MTERKQKLCPRPHWWQQHILSPWSSDRAETLRLEGRVLFSCPIPCPGERLAFPVCMHWLSRLPAVHCVAEAMGTRRKPWELCLYVILSLCVPRVLGCSASSALQTSLGSQNVPAHCTGRAQETIIFSFQQIQCHSLCNEKRDVEVGDVAQLAEGLPSVH